MRHIHTSIISRYLAVRGNNKILRTLPPHISSYYRVTTPPHSSYRYPTQNKNHHSQILLTQSTPTHIYNHYSTFVTHNTSHLFNFTHICTTLSPLDLWTDPAGMTSLPARCTKKLAGGPQTGRSDSPPLVRVNGVGRQQQHHDGTNSGCERCNGERDTMIYYIYMRSMDGQTRELKELCYL